MHNKYGKRESDAPLVKGGQGRTRQETETNAIITASFLLAGLILFIAFIVLELLK